MNVFVYKESKRKKRQLTENVSNPIKVLTKFRNETDMKMEKISLQNYHLSNVSNSIEQVLNQIK